MNKLLLYLLESGICLLVFFSLYQIFLKRETYYHLKRAYLLFSILFSLLVPILNISLSNVSSLQMRSFLMEPLIVGASGYASLTVNTINIWEVLGFVYFSTVIILSVRVFMNFIRIQKLYRDAEVLPENHYNLVLHSMNYPPFSFLRNIFISRMHYSDGQLDDIIEHEKAHVQQLHTIDMLLSEILVILQWFNPMAWLYKNLVRENHEFLADEAVIHRGFSPEAYQLRILAQLFGIRSMPAAHNFNQSITQKRLKMMEKSKSPAASRLKLLLVLPAAIFLFYMFACKSGQSDLSAQDTPADASEQEVFLNVDEAAEPEGGVMAFRKYIVSNILYPEEAKKKGVQGKVYIQFIVDENGKLVKAVESSKVPPPPPPPPPVEKEASGEVTPPPPPPETANIEGIVVVGYRPPEGSKEEYAMEDIQLLANEAVRVIMESDLSWKPAKKDGKAVKTAWTIPISFMLD
ncbi:M56 family metallopeptidase [Bacteroidota bacterium]